jgi:iron complex outermembrane receptor protein
MAFGSAWGATGSRVAKAALAGISLLAFNTALHAQTGNPQSAAVQPAGVVNVSVPAGPLESGLLGLGRQTNLRMVYPSNLTAGKRTAGVSGRITPQQAVTQILAGTGLRAAFTSANTVQVYDPSAPVAGGALPPGAIPLDTIDVQGANQNSVLGNLPPPYAGGQVASGGRLGLLGNRSVMDTPFNQTSYTHQTIQDQQARTLSDVFDNDPSVRDAGPRGLNDGAVRIRGFVVGGTDVGFNGLYGLGLTGSTPQLFSAVERVEILKGPSALLNGMPPEGSVGGSINLITKRAGDEPLTQLTTSFVSKSQFGTHLDIGRRFGERKEFGVRFNGNYRNGNTSTDRELQETGTAVLGLDYRTDRARIAVDLGYQTDDLTAHSTFIRLGTLKSVPAAPRAGTSFSQPGIDGINKTRYGIIQGEIDITDNVTAYASLGASSSDLSFANLATTLINLNGDFTGTPSLSRLAYSNIAGQAGIRSSFNTGPVHHALTFNFSKSDQTASQSAAVTGPLISNNIYFPRLVPFQWSAALGDPSKVSERTQSSVGIADTMSLFDKRIQLTVGVRRQQVAAANFNRATGIQTSSYDEYAWSPAYALVVKPWENVSFYANYIEGLSQGAIVGPQYLNAGEVCQSAFKFDPSSASNFDPFERWGLAVALASSELGGVAETWRARAV